jgi:16S rRNA (cytidine1402-2'-O)-methyltransferase
MGTLYVVATPIGNLGDLSERARATLCTVPIVFAEDTRVSRKLLSHIGSKARLISHHEYSSPEDIEKALDALESGDAALVTDAGTPGTSDPGAAVVEGAVNRGHRVVSVPGPSAVAAALSISGFPAGRYLFLGFTGRSSKERRAQLERAKDEPGPVVIFESPHRVLDLLADVAAVFGDRRICVCRELTKLHEEAFRGTSAEAIAYFEAPRGEFVVVIEGAGEKAETGSSDEEVIAMLSSGQERGETGRTLVDAVTAEAGVARSRVYRLWLDMERSG